MKDIKRLIVLPVILMVAGMACGQTINDHITLSIDKADGRYAKGESVRVYAQSDSTAANRNQR